ncbi:uncharacterized protein LOC113759728 [Coffea eugenioides]|uniref:uncharacterized protein LOC113759728 n=1 Tax=Coffea eugenioides TaxID=49369 RepID=UPI000F609BBE|nr:uncharacterized protein LOC113759728 [Coffea eugenioides]
MGLRQGDPLSPALFVIGAEVLSRVLNNLIVQAGFQGFKVSCGCPPVTHLAFADNMLIFANGSARALQNIIRVLDLYQKSSGQLVNGQKSGYVVHPSVSVARQRVIERITGFPRQQAPFRYLGFPLHFGKGKASHYGEVEYSAGSSDTWKRLVNVSRQAELSMRWLVYAGTCDFWYDNWLGTRALFHKASVNGALSFRDFLTDGRWNSLLLAQYFPSDITAMILQHPTPEGERPDEVVWMPTTSGQFSLSSAFQEVRQSRNASWLFSHIWHPQIPLKVSFFMLSLLLRRLPLDDILGKFGVQNLSKCFCCLTAEGESIEHIFATGQLAMAIWDSFGATCGIFLPQVPLRDRLVAWWLSTHSDPQR